MKEGGGKKEGVRSSIHRAASGTETSIRLGEKKKDEKLALLEEGGAESSSTRKKDDVNPTRGGEKELRQLVGKEKKRNSLVS